MNWKPAGVEEALLGFDARERGDPADWNAERRATFLLRPEVQRPLSVDTAVWPSVFGEGPGALLKPPDWRGPNSGLWDDLPRMRSALSPLASGTFRTVAVSWLSTDGFPRHGQADHPPYVERMVPPALDPGDGWHLLGLDVADAGFISGLSNCGYDPSELACLREAWASDLNEHHLFTHPDRAFAFRALIDRRAPEHAPFFVYALYEHAR